MEGSKYKRVLLKISGEGFCEEGGSGIGAQAVGRLVTVFSELRETGVQIAVVNGAGNLVRGAALSEKCGLTRSTADQMGMLATVINSLALQDALKSAGVPTKVVSAPNITSVCEPFRAGQAISDLEAGHIVILAGGTGNPFFTTDTCAALRCAEIQGDLLIKATKVDGVYDMDPVNNPQAKLYQRLTYSQILREDLKVMDHAAVTICRESHIDIVVCNLMSDGVVKKVFAGEESGTLISKG
jgi:uridylate kinase